MDQKFKLSFSKIVIIKVNKFNMRWIISKPSAHDTDATVQTGSNIGIRYR